MNRSERTAFTLVELLVVIAIIGVIIALLLPAVQAAREAARRSSCSSNLKQLGLAIQQFHELHNVLPRGAVWAADPNDPPASRRQIEGGGSLLIFLLPFIEEQSLYDLYDFSDPFAPYTMVGPGVVGMIDTQTFPGTTTRLGTAVQSLFLCPSDDHDGKNSSGWGLMNYAGNTGPRRLGLVGNNLTPCKCAEDFDAPFAPWTPAPFGATYAGVFWNHPTHPWVTGRKYSPTRIKQITDGVSKTIFMGEVRPACSVHANTGWGRSNNSNRLATTMIPINYDTCLNDPGFDGCRRPCNWKSEIGFKSAHPQGAFFLMGDGSVHFINEDIDMRTYQYLGAKADFQVVQIPE